MMKKIALLIAALTLAMPVFAQTGGAGAADPAASTAPVKHAKKAKHAHKSHAKKKAGAAAEDAAK
jgi:hypothetical protein